MFRPRFSRNADRLTAADDSLWQIHNDAMNRHQAGDDIILMSVGDPDLPTIDPIIENAVTSLYRGRTHYSPGMGELALREKIAQIETDASGKDTSADNVIVFPGATNAIYSVLRCICDESSELIVTEPTYIGYQGIFKTIGMQLVSVETRADAGFCLDVQKIKDAVTPDTRAIFLNTPGNPSGHVIKEADLRDIAEFARQQDIWLICDEVYSMLTFERDHISARRAAQSLDNVIIIDGLSKSHAMTGWRLGWSVAPASAIESILSFTSATVFGCSQFIQDAAAFALENDADYIAEIRDEYRSRRDYAIDRISALPGVSCHTPEAGMFLMLDVSQIAQSGELFARQLLDDAQISVLPGIGFGQQTAGHVRISLTHNVEELERAFDRIDDFLNQRG